MSEVKRYDAPKLRAFDEKAQGFCVVEYSDYKALQLECDELARQLALALKVPSVAAMHVYLDTECAKQNVQLAAERDEARRVLGKCQEMLDPHRDAVLWGEVVRALGVSK